MQKNMTTPTGPIVWAIDPTETRISARAPLAKFLKTLSRGLAGKVMPFSVVATGPTDWRGAEFEEARNAMMAAGQKSVGKTLKRLRMKNVSAPTVSLHESLSRRELVDGVIDFSKRNAASFIAVNTKRLNSRFPSKVGGFAEALIGKSNVPVIAVSPEAKISGTIKRILFPTDFSPSSKRAFKRAVGMAKTLGAKIDLVHLEDPVTPAWLGLADMPVLASQYWSENSKEIIARENAGRAARWCAQAKRAGVKCAYRALSQPLSVEEAILLAAKEAKSNLIVLPSYRNADAPALVGGTVRAVMSRSKVPIIEFRGV